MIDAPGPPGYEYSGRGWLELAVKSSEVEEVVEATLAVWALSADSSLVSRLTYLVRTIPEYSS